jgi:hypothetical protein
MKVYLCWTRRQLESKLLPGPCDVISMHDPDTPPPEVLDTRNLGAQLTLAFHDITERMPNLRIATFEDCQKILAFAEQATAPTLVVQCEAGCGRSRAVIAALTKVNGGDPTPTLKRGTHNRPLYRDLLQAAGFGITVDPLVSIVVRVKYPVNRLEAFLLSMERQRYTEWQVVAVTDGPNPAADATVGRYQRVAGANGSIALIQTPERKGRWGHPWRQMGIDATRGEYIGLSNDDNYYVPGYIEQMLNAMAEHQAPIAMCDMVHSYHGWQSIPANAETSQDVGCWIAKAELVKATPWQGAEFTSDAAYLRRLVKAAGGKVAYVHRPLFVHN